MHSTTLPVHPTLIDPATGKPLEALAVIGGRPVWPVIGGAEDVDDDPEPDGDGEKDSPEEPDDTDEGDKKKPDTESFDETRFQKALSKKNSENSNLRKRLAELEPLAAKAKELEDAGKSEAERLTERATSAEERADKTEAALLRLQVALEKALPADEVRRLTSTARRLVGTTKEELEEDADDLLASFASKDTKSSTSRVPGRPKEKLRGGGDPDEPVEETDPQKLAAAIPRS